MTSFLAKNGTQILLQPTYFPDIAPNDFFLFSKLKAVLKGRHFDTRDDMIEKSPLALKSIPKEAYKNCFDNWEKRWRCTSTRICEGSFTVNVRVSQYNVRERWSSSNLRRTNGWRREKVLIGQWDPGMRVRFISSFFISDGSVIALDNIEFLNCHESDAFNKPLNCTFEEDECGWFEDNSPDQLSWKRDKIRPSSVSGPKSDHTSGKGYFLYAIRAYIQYAKKARLYSASQEATSEEGRCLALWYHMFGQDVGSLNIYILTNGSSPQLIWSKSNSQGNAWRMAQRTIKSNDSYTDVPIFVLIYICNIVAMCLRMDELAVVYVRRMLMIFPHADNKKQRQG
ncbi:hypothetical protein LAZ67_X003100 [Cordylochernes scorpioides]|uniref:MAM domain-containing protein n=1 Tax=Cordylochernes scorpioides TaxID=51811 RepID=A0ABY6LTW0_9ARAC|nr:hypothetical protein LAZ67_X003100 [Cordylochernes scorpioides]